MKRLETIQKVTTVLLIISVLVVIIFLLFFHGGTALVAIVQCINLSIALCIISVLDKHYMPLY